MGHLPANARRQTGILIADIDDGFGQFQHGKFTGASKIDQTDRVIARVYLKQECRHQIIAIAKQSCRVSPPLIAIDTPCKFDMAKFKITHTSF